MFGRCVLIGIGISLLSTLGYSVFTYNSNDIRDKRRYFTYNEWWKTTILIYIYIYMKTKKREVKRTIQKHKKNNINKQKNIVLNLMREFKWPKTERNNVLRKNRANICPKRGLEITS